jgi:hypothetical protein
MTRHSLLRSLVLLLGLAGLAFIWEVAVSLASQMRNPPGDRILWLQRAPWLATLAGAIVVAAWRLTAWHADSGAKRKVPPV